MAFRVDEFKSLASRSGGFAVGNTFAVTLPSLGIANTRELNLLCKSTALPGLQITTIDKQMGTTVRKVANGFAVGEVSMVFHVMHDHAVKAYFEAWMNLVHNRSTYEVGYYYDYVQPIKIQHLQRGVSFNVFKKQLGFTNKIPGNILERLPDIGPIDIGQGEIQFDLGIDNTPVYTCELLEAYPIGMNQLLLGNDVSSVLELEVTFAYKSWKSGRETPDDNLLAVLIGAGAGKLKDIFD